MLLNGSEPDDDRDELLARIDRLERIIGGLAHRLFILEETMSEVPATCIEFNARRVKEPYVPDPPKPPVIETTKVDDPYDSSADPWRTGGG